ncbi:MAG: DNA-processing protein DprA [Planctomycetota bacterium]|jgi:DNA processing protein
MFVQTPVHDVLRAAGLSPLLHLALAGPCTVRHATALIEGFGTLTRALTQPTKRLRACGIPPKLAGKIHAVPPRAVAREVQRAAKLGIALVGYGDPQFPEALYDLTDDAPLVLYRKGQLDPDRPRVAMVGSRRASPYGRRMARELATTLAAGGVTVVSGLARGIDGEAHTAALAAGGRTIAVLGCGLDVCYPKEHRSLMARIPEQGCVFSEWPLGTGPLPHHFPRRNRIVSGLSAAVCIVEAAQRSGSLTTAGWALDQGREVLCVPHRLGDPGAAGSLSLLRDGAQLITGPEDIFCAIGLGGAVAEQEALAAAAAPTPQLSPSETAILAALSDTPRDLDAIIGHTGLAPTKVFQVLLDLEAKKLVRAGFGKTFTRT